MIQHRAMLTVADNTGASKLMCIRIHGGYKKRYARIGDMITCVVKECAPHMLVKRSDIVHAVLVRTRKELRRSNGTFIRFDDNAVVLLEKGKMDPKAGRIFGPIPRELAEKGFQKIISLAQEVI